MSDYDLLIKSSSRTTGSASSSNFTINLPESFNCKGRRFLKLKYLQCYNTIYNVDATNNALNFNENSANKSITPLTPSGYTGTTLATALQTALNTASSGYNTYVVTYSASTGLFTISAGNPFTLLFSSGTNSSTSLWKVMGWTTSNGLSPVNSATASSVTSPYMANLTNPLSMYLNLSKVNSIIRTSDTPSIPFTYNIPIKVPYGQLIELKEDQLEQKALISDPLFKVFTVQLIGPNGNAVNLNGSEWEFMVTLVDC
jgi:hypothetical protein